MTASDFIATYRLQLGPNFDFAAARAVVPYLQALGVSHVYLSPIMQARDGSTHGYDVVDPTRVSDALGGESGFRALAESGLGVVLDVVPNHMAAVEENPFWRDRREQFFDLDPVTGAHRRFFDVGELAGVRVEDPEVFAVTHAKVFELIDAGLVQGLRVDHVDGLAAPARYLEQLRDGGAAHVWVEKILETGEPLRAWPVEGTTGYEFLNDVTALFVDASCEDAFTMLSREARPFAEVAHEAKLEQATSTFVPEVEWLERLDDSESIAEGLALLPVYRTYVDPVVGIVDDLDREFAAGLPEQLRRKLLREEPARPEFVTRFQQTSGAVMAKGVEDTAFYRYVRLLALNEVGGDPGRFGLSVEAFHRANEQRLRDVPRTLLTAQTHDTKRSPDVRARIVALTHHAGEWIERVRLWHQLNFDLRAGKIPGWSEELFLYQTLVGAWPISWDRLEQYLVKAMREAKRTTSWIAPDEQWEAGMLAFARSVTTHPPFLERFEPFVADIAFAAERISIGQVVLRFTAPGVPDIYQGDELWDLSLVDPDNRRPVDWEQRRVALGALESGGQPTRETAKLFVVQELLALRRRRPQAFSGAYTPLTTKSATTCAFRRGEDVVVVVPTGDESPDIALPEGTWRNVLAGLEPLYGRAPTVYERIDA
jgi:(1->4)-alpha-D-glucan 1-alpha-D-glucosylmutase